MIYGPEVTNRIGKLRQALSLRIQQIKASAKREALRKRAANKVQSEKMKHLKELNGGKDVRTI